MTMFFFLKNVLPFGCRDTLPCSHGGRRDGLVKNSRRHDGHLDDDAELMMMMMMMLVVMC